MGCPTGVLLDDSLQFSIAVHDPDTGAKSNADSAPEYKVYDNSEIDVVVDSGTMSRINSSTLTGFYIAELLCSPTNGFTDSADYTICIEAEVNSIVGGITYGFTVYEKIEIAIGVPITIQGYDAVTGQSVMISGRYK